MMLAWHVAKTKPRQELQTSTVLQTRGLETYFPFIVPRRRARTPERFEPLFPGYLFVRLDTSSPDWVVARSAPGISYFLGFDRVPTPIPDDLVAEIRRRVERHEYQSRRPSLRSGDRVAIVGGPLDGVEAIFDGTLSPTGRSRVLVAIVNRLVTVQVDVEQLQPVK